MVYTVPDVNFPAIFGQNARLREAHESELQYTLMREKTVLIVVSSYAPAMIADMQRARVLAWELPKLGWDVEILAPDASYQQRSCLDTDSTAFFSPATPVHYARPLPAPLRWLVGPGTIGWRAILPMYAAAKRLFANRHYDLAYFSTTQFNLFLLGSWWRRRYGLPYVLDIHDPIYDPGPAFQAGTPPGVKRTVSRLLCKHFESRSIRAAGALVSVAPEFLDSIEERYGKRKPAWLLPGRRAVIPFAGSERDIAEAAGSVAPAPRFEQSIRRIVYVGAGGPLMAESFTELCRSLRHLAERRQLPAAPIRIELYGTMLGWREGDRKHLAEIAAAEGVADFVTEDPRRVSYRMSLELACGADGLLVLGVKDEGYVPSKLYAYALTGKPLLGVLHQRSAACNMFRAEPRLGHLLLSDAPEEAGRDSAGASLRKFLDEVSARDVFDRREAIGENIAPIMAQRHAAMFNACIAGAGMPRRESSG